eukprot:157944-Prorocentrum_minimum.AAC.4
MGFTSRAAQGYKAVVRENIQEASGAHNVALSGRAHASEIRTVKLESVGGFDLFRGHTTTSPALNACGNHQLGHQQDVLVVRSLHDVHLAGCLGHASRRSRDPHGSNGVAPSPHLGGGSGLDRGTGNHSARHGALQFYGGATTFGATARCPTLDVLSQASTNRIFFLTQFPTHPD